MAATAGDAAVAGTLARVVVRQLTAANACAVELAGVVPTDDAGRLAAIVMSLYSAWGNAELALTRLEAMFADDVCHRFARDALRKSRELASLPLARAWRRLRRGEPIQVNQCRSGGAGGGGFVKNIRNETNTATEDLLGTVLRQMDLANACLCELEVELTGGNRETLIVAAAALHNTWAPA